jgi:hypothetical protein
MALDKHGQLDAAVIAFYVPIAILTLSLVIRNGIRQGGWIFLFSFSLGKVQPPVRLLASDLPVFEFPDQNL